MTADEIGKMELDPAQQSPMEFRRRRADFIVRFRRDQISI